MKKQVEDWLLLADKDLYAAEILLGNEYPQNGIKTQVWCTLIGTFDV